MKTTAQLLRACQQQLERRQQRLVLLCTDHLIINAANSAALILDDQSSDRFAMHRYRDYLGTSNTLVVLNFTHAVHADALAALAGTVVAGGVLIINLPAAETAFCQRLLRHAEACKHVVRLTPDYTLTDVLQQLSAQPDEHLAVAHHLLGVRADHETGVAGPHAGCLQRPRAEGDSALDRSLNRRVELRILALSKARAEHIERERERQILERRLEEDR